MIFLRNGPQSSSLWRENGTGTRIIGNQVKWNWQKKMLFLYKWKNSVCWSRNGESFKKISLSQISSFLKTQATSASIALLPLIAAPPLTVSKIFLTKNKGWCGATNIERLHLVFLNFSKFYFEKISKYPQFRDQRTECFHIDTFFQVHATLYVLPSSGLFCKYYFVFADYI